MSSGVNQSRRSFNRFTAMSALPSMFSQRVWSNSGMLSVGVQNRRAYGVNCFDLFLGRFLKHDSVRRPIVRFQELSQFKVPFVRFPVSPFWPDEWRKYKQNENFFFDTLDELFYGAERSGIGLIPTLFWNPISVSDLMEESLSAWGDPSSRTVQFAKEFISAVVGRYKTSQSLWAWEVANEVNTFSDLPDALKWTAKPNPSRGTPLIRSDADRFRSSLVKSLMNAVESEVSRIMQGTPISGGYDAPRKNAHNLQNGKSKLDSIDEARAHFLSLHNDRLNLMSVHVYPEPNSKSDLALRDESLIELHNYVEFAKRNSKILFVGEFGVRRLPGEHLSSEKIRFGKLIERMRESDVRIAALWVYDFQFQNDSWSIRVGGDREYQLSALNPS